MKKNHYILLFYAILAFLFWGIPIKFNFINGIHVLNDPAFYLWSFKWWPYAISHGINPFVTKAFWSPFGQNLTWTTSLPSIAISMWPITECFGPVLTYNLITVISLALAPFGIYLINIQLGLKKEAAIFGGMVLFFSSYIWGQLLGHLNLYVVFVIIYLIYLYVLRFKHVISKKIYITLFTLLLSFQFGISNEIYSTFVVFSAVGFLLLFLLYLKNKPCQKEIINLGIETVISIILSAIVLSPYIYYILHDYVQLSIGNNIIVADPLNYFIPTPLNLLFGNLFTNISSKFAIPGNYVEEGAYLGLPLIIILTNFACSTIKNLRKKNTLLVFILILFWVSVLSSFGTSLRILNQQTTIPMPWLIFGKMPLIKQALPARFTLYVDIIASIIAAIWFEKFDKKILKYVISVATIIFLIPNLSVYKTDSANKFSNINNTIPFFITSGEYKSFIKKGDNVIILPSYWDGGFQAPIWQYSTNFYFNTSQTYAGTSPKQVESLVDYFYIDGFRKKENMYPFAIYLEKCNVKYILLDENRIDIEKELDKYIPSEYKIISDGVILYRIDSNLINKIKESQKNYYFEIFSTLYDSAKKFIKDGNNIADMYPQYLEKNGYLDESFDGKEKADPSYNWTKNGKGWIGEWAPIDDKGTCFGVGIMGDKYIVKSIIEKYNSEALEIYFPYPKIYQGDIENINDQLFGQLLIIFRAQTK